MLAPAKTKPVPQLHPPSPRAPRCLQRAQREQRVLEDTAKPPLRTPDSEIAQERLPAPSCSIAQPSRCYSRLCFLCSPRFRAASTARNTHHAQSRAATRIDAHHHELRTARPSHRSFPTKLPLLARQSSAGCPSLPHADVCVQHRSPPTPPRPRPPCADTGRAAVRCGLMAA